MVNPLVLAPVLEIGKTLIDRFFPDKEKAREAEADMLRMLTQADIQSALMQLEINAREATHPSIWVAGGRPFFIWISGVAFAYSVIIQPILVWIAKIQGWPEPPAADSDLLWIVITGLLGLGGLRSVEKVKKVTK